VLLQLQVVLLSLLMNRFQKQDAFLLSVGMPVMINFKDVMSDCCSSFIYYCTAYTYTVVV